MLGVPDKPAESLIIKKLKGTAGARMPQNKPPLAKDVIAKFETWIAEGARFDGTNPAQSTRMLAALVRAKSATNDELSVDRTTAGRRQWALANPNDKSTVRQTKDLIVISSLPDELAQEMADTAEQQAEAISRQFRVPTGQPLVKGAHCSVCTAEPLRIQRIRAGWWKTVNCRRRGVGIGNTTS